MVNHVQNWSSVLLHKLHCYLKRKLTKKRLIQKIVATFYHLSTMKTYKLYLIKWLLLLFVLFLGGGVLGGCAGSKGQPSEQEKGKKKSSKRCKMKSCHVRMMHMHEGTEFKGKRKWSLKACFFFNKNPKYGEGYKKDQRDPHQGKRN